MVFDQPIDFVAEQPDTAVAADLDDGVEDGVRDDLPGGVVGKVDRDQLRIGPQRGAQEIYIEVPITIDIERYTGHLANAERHRFRGLVVWRDDDCMVAGVQQHLHRDVDSLLGAREAEQVLRSHRIVRLRDLRAQRRRPAGLRVTGTDALEGRAILGPGQRKEFRERHVFAVRPRQVVFGGAFPLREIDLQREISHPPCFHGTHPDVPCVWASPPIRPTSICGYGMPMPRWRSSPTSDKLSSPATPRFCNAMMANRPTTSTRATRVRSCRTGGSRLPRPGPRRVTRPTQAATHNPTSI